MMIKIMIKHVGLVSTQMTEIMKYSVLTNKKLMTTLNSKNTCY